MKLFKNMPKGKKEENLKRRLSKKEEAIKCKRKKKEM